MSQISLEQILEAAKQLPPDERNQFLEMLLAAKPALSVRKKGRPVAAPVLSKDRSREAQWLATYGKEYAGQWVALEGKRLIAHSFDADEVFAAADASGINRPLFVRVEDPDSLPFAGW